MSLPLGLEDVRLETLSQACLYRNTLRKHFPLQLYKHAPPKLRPRLFGMSVSSPVYGRGGGSLYCEVTG